MFPSETLVLSKFGQVLRRRIGHSGLFSIFRAGRPRSVIYLDLGLHRKAIQIQRVAKWFENVPHLTIYGFEANPEYYEDCMRLFEGDRRVNLINAALVGPDHTKSTVTLHVGGKLEGLGDSLFINRDRHTSTIDVPAVRLSEFLRQKHIDDSDAAVIIRMNIEGAELHVLRDLTDAALIGRIDGWYGLWNDCGKIDRALGQELDALKNGAGIENVSFNDRDSKGKYVWLKEALIRYDLDTMISETN